MRENDFLSFIRQHTPPHAAIPLNIGDDMAALRAGDQTILLKIDQCLDQVHFDLRHHSAQQAGTKAVNRTLSDCAAMAALPTSLMISVALPREGPGSGESFAKDLFLACRDAAAKFNCPLVGGDTAIWDQRLVITVAATATPAVNNRYLTRAGAKPGDTLFVSGALGGSILGRHLTFTPRIHLAKLLAEKAGEGLHAMMDLSDGLAQDLPRLAAASQVGAQIHTDQLPIHDDAIALSQKDNLPPGLHALADGEDYELLFAIDSEAVPNIIHISDIPLTAIGTVTAEKKLVLIDDTGKSHPWPNIGFQHHT